jgi:hypothetical protein
MKIAKFFVQAGGLGDCSSRESSSPSHVNRRERPPLSVKLLLSSRRIGWRSCACTGADSRGQESEVTSMHKADAIAAATIALAIFRALFARRS